MNIDSTETIRSQCIAQQAALLEQAQATLTAKGCVVHLAQTAAEAQAWIAQLCGSDAVLCTYAPELEEIHFSETVPQAMQTDLEAVVAQALHKPYLHPHRAPLDGVSPEQITTTLQQYFKEPVPADQLASAITQRIKFAADKAAWGVTGADAIAADTGTLVLAEDQGNGRLVSNIPMRHLAVVGLEKLYPSNETALESIHTAWKNGGPQDTPTYYSYITGPSRTGDIEGIIVCGMHGPLEVHVVLLDNGRSQLLSQGNGKILQCIDCGNCTAALQQLLGESTECPTPLTCKTLALAQQQHPYTIAPEAWNSFSFSCPVGITPQDCNNAMTTKSK